MTTYTISKTKKEWLNSVDSDFNNMRDLKVYEQVGKEKVSKRNQCH